METEVFPLRLGSAVDFARVASSLRAAHFDEPTIRRLFALESMADLGSARRDQLAAVAGESAALALLMRLFLFLEAVPRVEVERHLDTATLASLLTLDLLRRGQAPDGGDAYLAPVLLYPVADLLLASDRQGHWDGTGLTPPPDVVFPAIFAGTLRFLRVIGTGPAGDALDLCAGTGVGALVLARRVRRVVATDLTARATHFARFNRLLNGCDNVEVVQGDLYEPVSGRTFDRIVAHPPYVPALPEQTQVYRDAGDTGESVLRGIVHGLPQYLRPGGTFYCITAGWDSADGSFETRVRRWLGDTAAEFDVLFAEHEAMSPAQLADVLTRKSKSAAPALRARWERQFAEAGLQHHVYGALVVHRVEEPGDQAPLPARLTLSSQTDGACFEWALRWRQWRRARELAGDLADSLLAAHPRAAQGLRVMASYAPSAGELAVTRVMLHAERPFRRATEIEAWMLPFVTACGRGRSARDVYDAARQGTSVPKAFGPADFATLLALMVEHGYVDIEDLA